MAARLLVFLTLIFALLALGGSRALAADTDAGADTDAEPEAPPKNCPIPDKVKTGVFVNNLQTLDLKTHTYEFDVYLWFKWCNPDLDPATSVEFLNPSELWGMMVTPNYEAPETLPDGDLYQVLRVQGRFSTKLPLYNYPFDRQVIGPLYEDSVHDATEMIYELDPVGKISLNPKLVMPGYILGEPRLAISTEPYPTNFGDTRSTATANYSRAAIELPLSRPLLAQMVLLMVPVFCVILCAALMFILSPTYVDSRVGVGTTAMLTIVALQMTYNQDLPDVGYLMLMDKVYLASYFYVIVGLAVVVRTTRLIDDGKTEDARRLHWMGLAASSIGYALLVILLTWSANKAG